MKPTSSQVLYKVAAFSLPISAAGMVNILSTFIATMMLARLGQAQLAAGALAVGTFITFNASLTSVFYAVGILIGYNRGQGGDNIAIGKTVRNGMWLAVFFTVPFAFILWHVDKLLLLVGEEAQLVDITRGYFHFAAFALLPNMLSVIVAQFFAGIGNSRFSFYVSFAMLPLVVIISYVLVLGNFGFPVMGLSGISCATLVAQTLLLFFVLLMMTLRGTLQKYHFFTHTFLPDLATCKSIFTLGFPIGMQFGGEIAAMTTATYMMGHFGETPLAALQVVGQYTMFIVMIFLGLTQSLSILISEAFGGRDIDMVQRYQHSALLIFGFVCVVLAIFFLGFPNALIHFYMGETTNEQFNYYARIFFALNFFFLMFDGIRNILSGALRGLHDSRVPMRIGIIALWIMSIPLSYLMGFSFHGGPIGLRVGFLLGIIYCAFWLWMRYRRKLQFILSN